MKNLLWSTLLLLSTPALAATIDVHPTDSLPDALARARQQPSPSTLLLHAGTYYLAEPLLISAADNNLTLAGAPNETSILSGGHPLTLTWTPSKNNILQATVPADVAAIDQLWINNEPQILARYPNENPAIPTFHGYARDAIAPERVHTWADPAGGFIHAMHRSLWGSQDYLITAKDAGGNLTYKGGWQTNRPAPMHRDFRFVENIFEELNAPHEFFFNPKTHTLFFQPPPNFDLAHASVEINHAETLLDLRGASPDAPATHITLQNLTLTHTNRTFMKTREPILQSDWCVARTAALLLTNTQDVSVHNCTFENLGGTAIFINNSNKNTTIDTCHIHDIGASAILVIGDPASVRTPRVGYNAKLPDTLDLTPGPLTSNYPTHCTITNTLIHDIGQIEKQVAGVGIDIASHITVSHCSIYNTPRAGINIGDGRFGGHLIEFNDVFNTVLETSDHGAFNSWGRDRFWSPDRKLINQRVAANPALPLLDVVDPITLNNNRFRCDHGWDIDLDDGSSNYFITNNVCLNGGLKLREGYDRHADNNLLLNNTLFAHVWLDNSHDTVTHNLFMRSYRPTGMPKSGDQWGAKVDNNFFTQPAALAKAHDIGLDSHSAAGDPQFLDAKAGNFEVAPTSPTLAAGFHNILMTFGVTDPALHKLARTPAIPPITNNDDVANLRELPAFFLGATIKTVNTDAEVSATGLSEKTGALVLEVLAGSPAAKAGLHKLDVILKADNTAIHTAADLAKLTPKTLQLFRNQSETQITLP